MQRLLAQMKLLPVIFASFVARERDEIKGQSLLGARRCRQMARYHFRSRKSQIPDAAVFQGQNIDPLHLLPCGGGASAHLGAGNLGKADLPSS
jgi:hypothetical protein